VADLINARITEEALRIFVDLVPQGARSARTVQQAVIGVATTAEVYVDRLLDLLVDASDVASNHVGSVMLGAVRGDMHRSWSDRYQWMKNAFDISINGSRPAQDLAAVIQVRNALIHGNGRLTRLQTRGFAQALRLQSDLQRVLNVTSQGLAINLSNDTAYLSSQIGRRFVQALDGQLSDAPRRVLNAALSDNTLDR
jgi:hypothetical protein